MKFVLIEIIIVLAIGISAVKSDCSFRNFTNNYRPSFYQKIYTQTIFVPAINKTVSIPDGGSVEAYCSGGFRSFKVGGEYNAKTVGDKIKDITIECRNSTIFMKIQDEIYNQGVNLQCKKPTISLHSVRSVTCGEDKDSFIMGLEYNSAKLALAEICYDFGNMQLKYIYHKAMRRTPILSQEQNKSVIMDEYYNPVEQISNSLTIAEEDIKSQTKVLFGSISGAVEYVYDHLVPVDSFDPYVTDSMETTSYLTKILWWKPLKEGNWRLFQDLLKEESEKNGYNIITGVSGAVTYSKKNCAELQNLKFEVNGLIKTAPKLIWSYLELNHEHSRPTNNYLYDYKGPFVVVGYNTPFFDKITAEDMCKFDICYRISWLRNLLESQKRTTLGNIVCCTLSDENIYKIIPELPPNIGYLGKLITKATDSDSTEAIASKSDENIVTDDDDNDSRF